MSYQTTPVKLSKFMTPGVIKSIKVREKIGVCNFSCANAGKARILRGFALSRKSFFDLCLSQNRPTRAKKAYFFGGNSPRKTAFFGKSFPQNRPFGGKLTPKKPPFLLIFPPNFIVHRAFCPLFHSLRLSGSTPIMLHTSINACVVLSG